MQGRRALYLEVAVGRDLADVARAEEADTRRRVHLELGLVLSDHVLIGVLGVDQVALADHRAADEHLTTWHSDLRVVLVGELVTALGPVAQLDARRRRRRAHHRRRVIAGVGYARRGARLRKAVALTHWAVERRLRELLDTRCEWRRSGDDALDLAAEHRLHLLEDDRIVQEGCADDILVEVGRTRLDALRKELLHERARPFHLRLQPNEDLI